MKKASQTPLLQHRPSAPESTGGISQTTPLEGIRQRDLRVPPLEEIRTMAEREGGRLYLVGGAVRDLLLGSGPVDFDLAGTLPLEEFVRRVSEHLGATWFRMHHRQILYRVIYTDPSGRTFTFDFTELKGPTIEEDLRNRDFTINSMAVDLRHPGKGLIDPLGGKQDLRDGILRLSAPESLREDPLRALRAYRFKAQLGMRFDASLAASLSRLDGLDRVSGERIRDELFRILAAPSAGTVIREMDRDSLLSRLFPIVETLRGVTQNEYHHLDVWGHSLLTLDCLEALAASLDSVPPAYHEAVREYLREEIVPERTRLAWLKLGALFHDIGKGETRFVDEKGRVRFFRHEARGEERIDTVLNRLAPARRERDWIHRLIRHHMRTGQMLNLPEISQRTRARYLRKAGSDFWAWLLLFMADHRATRGPASMKGDLSPLKPRIDALIQSYLKSREVELQRPSLIRGRDLAALFHLPPGPIYGRILEQIEMGMNEGRIRNREEALEEVRRLLRKEPADPVS